MSRVLVTGATGNLGRLAVEALLRRRDDGAPIEVAASVRRTGVADDLANRGVDVRRGDYLDGSAMRAALRGVDRLLLVSAPAFTDRAAAHLSVVDAARQAGVEHIVYTSVQGQGDGRFTFSEVTASDAVTIDALRESPIRTTVAYNSLFLDSLIEMIGDEPATTGTISAPAGRGAVAAVARRDLAEAYAIILTATDPAESYTLTGPQAVTISQLAGSFGAHHGSAVTYRPSSVPDFVSARRAAGVPEPVAAFLAEWYSAIAAGAFPATSDFERLVGRPAATVAEFLAGDRDG